MLAVVTPGMVPPEALEELTTEVTALEPAEPPAALLAQAQAEAVDLLALEELQADPVAVEGPLALEELQLHRGRPSHSPCDVRSAA